MRAEAWGETLHPVAGPMVEAQTLYVNQLDLVRRLREADRPLVVWDVGVGAGANALMLCRATEGVPGSLRLLSFDLTLEPLAFALHEAAALEYPKGYENHIETLIRHHRVDFEHGGRGVEWTAHLGDFSAAVAAQSRLAGRPLSRPERTHDYRWPAPDVILFDPYSPRRNPGLWSLEVFEALRACMAPDRPCRLATYSRSTAVRVGLLLAGFHVGCGLPVAGKEETTVACDRPGLLEHPLDAAWLARALRSSSAEPIRAGQYAAHPLSPEMRTRLSQHPQFQIAGDEIKAW